EIMSRCRRLGGIELLLALGHVADQLHLLRLALHQIHALLDHARGALMGERDTGECDQEHKQGGDGPSIDRARRHVRPSVVMAVVKIAIRVTPCTPSCRLLTYGPQASHPIKKRVTNLGSLPLTYPKVGTAMPGEGARNRIWVRRFR